MTVIDLQQVFRQRGRDVYEPPPFVHEKPVNRSALAEHFGVSTRTVDRWVSRDGMPQRDRTSNTGCWVYVGTHRRFWVSQVWAWLDQQGVQAEKPAQPVPEGEQPVYVSSLAQRLGVSPPTIRKWIQRGCPRRGLPPMPQDLPGEPGCWTETDGGLRVFYESRVREWLALDDRPRNEMGYVVPKALRDMQEQRQAAFRNTDG